MHSSNSTNHGNVWSVGPNDVGWTETSVLFAIVGPVALLLFAIVQHGSQLIPWSTNLREVWRSITFPVRNFITFEDFIESAGPELKPSRWTTRCLVTLSTLECAIQFGTLIYLLSIYDAEFVYLVSSGVGVVTWLYSTAVLWRQPPKTPPYTLMGLFTCSLFSAIYSAYVHQYWTTERDLTVLLLLCGQATLFALLLWLAGTLPLLPYLTCPNVAELHKQPTKDSTSPEDRANVWQWSSFAFVQPILDLSMTRTLDEADIWSLSPFFKHKNLFHAYLRYRNRNPKHSLLRFLITSNSLDLILDVVLEMWSAIVGFATPYGLQRILSSLAKQTSEGKREAYLWTWVIFGANLSFAQVDVFQRWHTRRCYERTRGQLFCALHYKALQRRDLSGEAVKENGEKSDSADLGRVVNLMQGDSYAVAQRFWEFSGIFASPVRLGIALYFLWQVLGWSSLMGVAVVLIIYILNWPLAKYSIYITRNLWQAKDTRMSLVNELFQNIRFLKFYGWESRWSSNAQSARNTELNWRIKSYAIDTMTSFLWTRIPAITTLVCFWSYTLLEGQTLTVSKAFTAMALFGSLQGPMTQLPGQVMALINAYVSMQRIEKFLDEEEVPAWATSLQKHDQLDGTDTIRFQHASFSWSLSSGDRFTLGPLDIAFPHGKLSLVCGATASGKSTLLLSLLGETSCLGGQVLFNKTNHHVAYCAQNPWLQHATIRDNITFNSLRGYQAQRYNAVIAACGLEQDLAILDAGDLTEIGERGIVLSGGQRARVAMARALYSDAKCILLDDPLAAVDMHTAAHLLEHALTGPLASNRSVILVTHHVRLCLPSAAYVVELENGQIIRAGTPTELDHLGILEAVIEEEDHVPMDDPEVGTSDGHTRETTMQVFQRQQTDGKLVEDEARAEGRVSIRTYLTYVKAAGIAPWFGTVALMILLRVFSTIEQLFIAKWGEAYEEKTSETITALLMRVMPITELLGLPPPAENVKPWFLVFSLIFVGGSLSSLAYMIIGYYASLKASRKLFSSMLANLSRAPARFFDKTPIGRILNRFTSDIGTVDGALQSSARSVLQQTLNFMSNILVICLVVPSFLPFAVVIFWLYVRYAPPYIQASRDLRRLESISLSPAFAGFDELLRGITHVRAFAMEGRFQDMFYVKVDRFQNFDHVYWLVANWLAYRYDLLGSVVVFVTGMFALWAGVSDGYAALVFVQAQTFADSTRYLVRSAAQLELDFNSVERIVEYLDVPQERPAIIADSRPPAYWPSSNGSIVVDNLVIRYAPELPPVLKGVSFVIKPSEKIGIVGRTGSGKSTLAFSILRMVEASEGTITIDGIDVSKIGLDDLRSRVTIVSQDVALFTGTIRSNIDPFDEHSDKECFEVLEASHLRPLLERGLNPEQAGSMSALDIPITAQSMSAGEKQLLALARAVLRKSNIVILDEATAQVDQELDDKIQETIRRDLGQATVIAIAHRLKTILDYDRVLVMDQGHIREFDTPIRLLHRSGSLFGDLCRKSADWPVLKAIAGRQSKS